MYHSVSDSGKVGVRPYYQTTTTPKMFAEQMRFLDENGYSPVSMPDALAALNSESSSPEKPVVITFDDGFEDFYTNAFPILSRHSFTATMYLPTAYIGASHQSFKGTPCMTWTQVRELHRAGIDFGGHTETHPRLRNLSSTEIRRELHSSKRKIEDELQSPVRSFAYPYAFPETDREFCSQLRDILQEAAYENGVSTILGTACRGENPYFLPRLPVNSCDDLSLFQAKLEGGYEWLHRVQYAAKLWSGVRRITQ